MIHAPLSTLRLQRIRTRAAHAALQAPELERFLARSGVDLLVTDQIDALKVRVNAGVEALLRRITQARWHLRRVVWRRASLAATTLTVAVVSVPGAPLFAVPLPWGICTVAGLATVGILCCLPRPLLELRTLAELPGRYDGRVQTAESAEELLQFSETVLAEARALGSLDSLDESPDLPTDGTTKNP